MFGLLVLAASTSSTLMICIVEAWALCRAPISRSVNWVEQIVGIWWKLRDNFDLFHHKNMLWGLIRIVWDDSNEYPQHMFSWRTDKNYPSIINKYPPYLSHCEQKLSWWDKQYELGTAKHRNVPAVKAQILIGKPRSKSLCGQIKLDKQAGPRFKLGTHILLAILHIIYLCIWMLIWILM